MRRVGHQPASPVCHVRYVGGGEEKVSGRFSRLVKILPDPFSCLAHIEKLQPQD